MIKLIGHFKVDRICVHSIRFKCEDVKFPIKTVYVAKGEFTEEVDEITVGICPKGDTSSF